MKDAVEKVMADPRYAKNVEYGEPRSGHPEGKVSAHILDLEANLEALEPRLLSEADYWKLKFLIHVHDSFKAEAQSGASVLHPRSHASLAKAFAAEFTNDADLLNIIQFHDENYALWKQFARHGSYDGERFQALLDTIEDWNLFLLFTIVDGCTEGKERSKLAWFINEVRQHKNVIVDETWVLP